MRKWTRRGFIAAGLVSGAALVVGVAVRPGNRVSRLKDLVATENESLVNAWVKINSDNRVTVIVPHCEMGQGVHTSLPMMLAEEMDIAWSSVEVMEAPDDLEYANYALGRGFVIGDVDIPEVLVPTVNGAFIEITQMLKLQITGGSTAIRTTGIHAMKMAGASAKEMLIQAASKHWKVAQNEIRTQSNNLYHDVSNRKASYAEFAALAAQITPPSAPKLKSVKDYQIVGKSPIRLDISGKVDGSASFGIDKILPNMLFAAVRNAPVFGSRLVSIESVNLEALGVIQIVEMESAVAVVAISYWQAEQVLSQLNINWSEDAASNVSTESIFSQFDKDMKRAIVTGDEKIDFSIGDAKQELTEVSKIIEAEYRQPYLAHAPMEPLNCTIEMKNDRCEVWTGSQNPLGFRAKIAEALDFDIENVKVNNSYLGGGFGRRSIADYAIQAALIARHLQQHKIEQPVKMVWSREEDIRQDFYRQASISRFKAGFDRSGALTCWTNQYVDKHEPEEAPHIPYDVANQSIHYVDSPTHVPFGPWRSVDHSLHGFFTESFIDEAAIATGKDPFLFRSNLLTKQPRMRKVLQSVAELSQWTLPLKQGWGRGIAIHQSFGTIVAQVAEVKVEGKIFSVKRVYCAVDCGVAINPDGLVAQMEGGIIYGLSAALYGEISIENGAVKQSNFDDYEVLRINESPEITVQIINSGEALGGGGEPGTPPIMAAVGNAIFSASGLRLRSIPFKL